MWDGVAGGSEVDITGQGLEILRFDPTVGGGVVHLRLWSGHFDLAVRFV